MNDGLNFDYSLLIPEFLLAGLAVLVLFVDMMMPKVKKGVLPYLTLAGVVGIFAVSLAWIDHEEDFAGLIFIDNYTTFFRCFFLATTAFVVIASARYVQDKLRNPGEYYALLLFSTIGAIYMAASRELLTAYISLEVLSFSLYILVSYAKFDGRSNEAGMKYVLLGAFASAILLYGISFIYGATSSTSYTEISTALAGGTADFQMGMMIGLVLIIAGLGFKVAAVPFHMWTPDAYEGAPLPITAYLGATSKAAGFAMLLRLFGGAFMPVIDDWRFLIAIVAASTVIVGNLIALWQHNVKRLLAYSSIGQVGYMLMGIVALSPEVSSALILHMTGYVITNMAAFVVIIAYHNETGAEEITDFRGMATKSPALAAALAIALFSLAGMPLFAGFLTKFILFQSVADGGYLWLGSLGVIGSLVSLYYYLQLMREMYVSEAPDANRVRVPPLMAGAIALLVVGVFVVGLYPAPLFDVTDEISSFLFT